MKMGWKRVLWFGAISGVLAGCQSSEVKFQVKDQRVPEQVGLKVDPGLSFGRDGVLANQPANYGRYYLENGILTLQVYRFTNTSSETRELYPSLRKEGAVATVSQFLWNTVPRTWYSYDIMTRPVSPLWEQLSEYRSEFEVLGAEFRFDGGGVEKVGFPEPDENPKGVPIRPGESAEFRVHLALRRETPLVSSAAPPAPADRPGVLFMPPGLNVDPASRPLRPELLIGATVRLEARLTILARDPVTDELNPVYLGEPGETKTLFRQGEGVVPRFPPEKVARTLSGLAILY